MLRYIYLLLLLNSPLYLFSQQLPTGQIVMNDFNILISESDSTVFTGYRTMDWLEVSRNFDSSYTPGVSESRLLFGVYDSKPSIFRDRVFQDHWVRYDRGGLVLTADPFLNAFAGKSNDKRGVLWDGTAGALMRGVFKNKLSFGIGAYTSISEFPAYLDKFIAANENTIPGQRQGTLEDNKRYRYSSLDAYVTYVPDRHVALTAGYGKQFIGDGYRSLLLSDNAFNYPYMRLKASYWKLQYNVMYSYLENDQKIDGYRQGKFSVNHYLGINIGKRLQVGLFENIIWVARDTNYNRGFDVQYINPLTFLRPVEFSLGSTDNSFFGLNWKYIIPKKGYLYGQFALDDLNIGATAKNGKQHINNKYAFQLGFWFNNFALKGLTWRLEWNAVRPYMYGHRKPQQNYTHNHQALAHPFGANFHEFLSIFNYRNGRWYGVLHNAIVIRGEDNTGILGYNNGNDLWGGEANVPELGSTTMQGVKNSYLYNRVSLGYLVNPANRLSLQIDIVYRNQSSQGISQIEFYYGLGVKTGLFNRFDDL